MTPDDLLDELRGLLVSTLRISRDPRGIAPDADLWSGELGLDSLDATALLAAIERHFGVQISDGDLARYSLATLSGLLALVRDKTGR